MPNPKSPPLDWWRKIISQINEPIVQTGITGEEQLVPDFRQGLAISRIVELINESQIWISVDSFLPHLAHLNKGKPGIVIWSLSDPNIFGYKENYNIQKSNSYLRKNQFYMWEEESYNPNAFPDVEAVLIVLNRILSDK
jgi:ADP-heptose:LPS heptosyltransferase